MYLFSRSALLSGTKITEAMAWSTKLTAGPDSLPLCQAACAREPSAQSSGRASAAGVETTAAPHSSGFSRV